MGLHQPDLFGRSDAPALPVAGLALAPDLINPQEEAALIAWIDAAPLTPFKFQQWEGKRLTCSFGWSYDFTNGAFAEADPLPDWLLPIRDRAAHFAGLPPADLVQALLIRYDPGAGIGWHRDRPVYEHVIGLSLGSPADLRLRRRKASGFDRATVPLAPRAIYHLSGEVRHDWEHSIAAMDVPRWSITFRSFSERGLRAIR